jgi:hypothetical protein
MIKLANIIERDLVAITTFTVLTSARYLMEMLIWFRLIDRNPDEFISYFIALQIAEQLQQAKATLENTKRELETYKDVAARQSKSLSLLKKRTKRNVSRMMSRYTLPTSNNFTYMRKRQNGKVLPG